MVEEEEGEGGGGLSVVKRLKSRPRPTGGYWNCLVSHQLKVSRGGEGGRGKGGIGTQSITNHVTATSNQYNNGGGKGKAWGMPIEVPNITAMQIICFT